MERPSVLIVAASPFHLALMGDLLEANDIRTLRAHRAAEALGCVGDGNPTMVVVDLDLPPAECRQLLDGLAAQAATRSIPVLAVTGPEQVETAREIVARTDGRAVEKPIDTGVFARTVVEEIRRHSSRERPALL
jgi:CheY-like chemotaxis protein